MAEAPEPAGTPSTAPLPADNSTPPMLPSRWAFLLAFFGVVLAGILGGIIGFGIADVSSQSDLSHLVGAFVGAVIGAGGVGIVAVLVLRAMAEWRRQDPSAPRPPRRPS
jgi:hypothetical protein